MYYASFKCKRCEKEVILLTEQLNRIKRKYVTLVEY